MSTPHHNGLQLSADDFGLSPAVNDAVEIAHRQGVLTAASLMVGAPAAADAIRRAHAMPNLRVGLHLVVIEGQATLPAAAIPNLVDPTGRFGSSQFSRGVAYFARPSIRRQLAAEIEAQFAAFASSGLTLAHADAHKHMHLHPTVGRLMIDIGRRHGLTRLRVPAEPPAILRRCGHHPRLADHALYHWTSLLRRQATRAGLQTDHTVFGIAWTGHMTADRLLALLAALPPGRSEIYSHPATHQDATLHRLMPGYDPQAELAALCDPRVIAALAAQAPASLAGTRHSS